MNRKPPAPAPARSRDWIAPEDPAEASEPLSARDQMALLAPLLQLATLMQLPSYSLNARSRLRILSALIATWSGLPSQSFSSGAEMVSIPSGPKEGALIPIIELAELADLPIQLVWAGEAGLSLSEHTWTPGGIDDATSDLLVQAARRLVITMASHPSWATLGAWLAADAEDLRRAGGRVPPGLEGASHRAWWVVDGSGTRAKRNAFKACLDLALAWAACAAVSARPFARTAPMLLPVARALRAPMTIGLVDGGMIVAPPRATRTLAELALSWRGDWGPTTGLRPREWAMCAKVYAASLAAAVDGGGKDLSWVQNHEYFAETFFRSNSGRVAGEIAEAFAYLRSLIVLRIGRYSDPEGQRLIDAVTGDDGGGKLQTRYRHCLLMHAAMGVFHDDDTRWLRRELVQVPRALIAMDTRSFATGLGGAILVRDSLTSVRKTGRIQTPPAEFFGAIGRGAEVRKGGAAKELARAARILEEGEVSGDVAMRDGLISWRPSAILLEAYANTMASAARYARGNADAIKRPRKAARRA